MSLNYTILSKTFVHPILWGVVLLFTSSLSHAVSKKTREQDIYVSGFLRSIFENNYGISSEAYRVCNNIVIIDNQKLEHNNPEVILDKTKAALHDIPYVKKVLLIRDYDQDTKTCNNYPRLQGVSKENPEHKFSSLPSGLLFAPLMADPAYPRFTLSYQYLIKDKYSKHAFAPNFGASFSLLRIDDSQYDKSWEIGVMAGLFGIMDIGRKPTALVNADYYVGLPITYKNHNFTTMARIYHLSSHLGDEFMLTKEGKKLKRINLSYEGIDLISSYEFNKFRLYGGGGYIVHKDPGYIKPLKFQAGLEYISNTTYINGNFRPVAGIDITTKQMAKYYPGISIKAGWQLENAVFFNKKVQIIGEYYKGKSPHGQFYNNKMEYIGISLQAFI